MSREWAPPAVPAAWHFVCRSAELRPGTVVSRSIGELPIAIFRTAAGAVHAVDAHCRHFGANLGRGDVVGERLRCPMHHREYDGLGACVGGSANLDAEPSLTSYPTTEAFGAILVFNGPRALYGPPSFPASPGRMAIRAGRSVEIGSTWYAVVANGFDLHHLGVVHRRELREEPIVERPDEFVFRMSYVARVSGNSVADRIVRRLSADTVRATVTCIGGTIITVESVVGPYRGALALCFVPKGGSVEIVPFVGVPRSRIGAYDAVRTWIARFLFLSFLERDVVVLDGMRFRPNPVLPEDACLAECLSFLEALPHAGENARKVAGGI